MAGHRFSRRWLLVAAGAAGLVAAGTVRLPAAPVDIDAEQLRARMLAPVRPHVGYVESAGRLGLPEIPQLQSSTQLLTSTTRIRTFVAGPGRWRVDQVDNSGERDTYHVDGGEVTYVVDGVESTLQVDSEEYLWDFGAGQLTQVVGSTPLRLPRASDLTPYDLGRRLLRLGSADPVSTLPARRIAGRDAAGLRLAPSDPETTVGHVDIWADVSGDPASVLLMRVEVAPRTGDPLLFTELVEVEDRMPDPADVTPVAPPGAGTIAVGAADISGALKVLDAAPPPDRLAGRDRVPLSGTPDAELPGVGLYGAGLAGFALIPVNADIARQAVDGAGAAGGTALEAPVGQAVALATPLVSVVAWARRRSGALLAGTVAPEVLAAALAELPDPRRR